MATKRKVKRFDEGGDTEFGDLEGAMEAAKSRAVQDQFDANEAANTAPATKPVARATPKAESKPAASSTKSGYTPMSKEAGEAAQAKFRESSKPAGSAPKKEMYRDFSGKMREKAPDTSAADAAANRDRAWNAIKGAASSVGDYISGLGRREEKHGTYVKDGKVVRYAKGGMTASKRADGIAQRGKTRGRVL